MAKIDFLVLSSLVGFISVVSVVRVNATKENWAHKINSFGCTLLQNLSKNVAYEENILVSPLNVYTSLALLYTGTAGRTRKELATLMNLPKEFLNSTRVHRELSTIISKLVHSRVGKPQNVTLANGIFLRDNFTFKDSYLNSVKRYYKGAIENLDFLKKPQKSMDMINNWILNNTRGSIEQFYEEPLDSRTVAILVSALNFNLPWVKPFSPKHTENMIFHTGVTEIEVPMMTTKGFYEYEDNEHYTSVSLPYSGGEYEMTIYLPPSDKYHYGDKNSRKNTTRKSYDDSENEDRHLIDLCPFNFVGPNRSLVDVLIPKMKISSKASLMDALKLDTILQPYDFSELTAAKNVELTDIKHATKLETDENGTVGSAATPIGHFNRMGPTFHVKRPFLVVVKHKPTETILFLGIIRKPIE